jgi:hypothetical protein
MLPGGALGAGVFSSETVESLKLAVAYPPAGALLFTALSGMGECSTRHAGFRF